MRHTGIRLTLVLLMLSLVLPCAAMAQLMIIGNDEKVTFDDAGGVIFSAPGKDTVSIVDISNREAPRIIANLPLINSLVGPPTNLAITPDERLALIANRADNSISVLSIQGKDVKLIDTVPMGEQVSAVSMTSDGKRAVAA